MLVAHPKSKKYEASSTRLWIKLINVSLFGIAIIGLFLLLGLAVFGIAAVETQQNVLYAFGTVVLFFSCGVTSCCFPFFIANAINSEVKKVLNTNPKKSDYFRDRFFQITTFFSVYLSAMMLLLTLLSIVTK